MKTNMYERGEPQEEDVFVLKKSHSRRGISRQLRRRFFVQLLGFSVVWKKTIKFSHKWSWEDDFRLFRRLLYYARWRMLLQLIPQDCPPSSSSWSEEHTVLECSQCDSHSRSEIKSFFTSFSEALEATKHRNNIISSSIECNNDEKARISSSIIISFFLWILLIYPTIIPKWLNDDDWCPVLDVSHPSLSSRPALLLISFWRDPLSTLRKLFQHFIPTTHPLLLRINTRRGENSFQ